MTCKDCVFAVQPSTTMRCRNHGIYVSDNAVVCNEFKGKPQTNYDRIVSKTPEELAEHLFWRICNRACPPQKEYTKASCGGEKFDCVKCWLGWLKQEAT